MPPALSNVSKDKALDPLKDLLTDVLARLETLESKVGIVASPAAASGPAPQQQPAPASTTAVGGEVPAVKAYDAYMKSAVIPFAASCEDAGLAKVGELFVKAMDGMRTVIVLASRSKPPSEDLPMALQPQLVATQKAVQELRELKLERNHDRHFKAVSEMLTCLSWVFYKAPAQPPAAFVKETLGSVEFWTNRIRKDCKDDPPQMVFCDNLRKVNTELVDYITEYHKQGLTFNPRGVSLAEAAILLADQAVTTDEATSSTLRSPVQKRHPTLGSVVAGPNMAGLMGELAKRQTQDGSSAATGLKHVTKDQQTWRKEFKKEEQATSLPSAPSLEEKKVETAKPKKKALKGLPIFEYQDRGFKWVIENQTKESSIKEISADGLITVDISDPKQQVYLYNCDDIAVKIIGKFKSLVLDNCERCAVVYETLISSAEVVNCKKIQLQVDGICPVFTIDKTINILVWLSKETAEVSKFTTSLSTEMNVSFPDGDDQKEMPIPEQFVHTIKNGSLSSEVSDLYH